MGELDWIKELEMITHRKRSLKQEKNVAKQFNAKQVIASGSLWFADSDVRSDKFLIECKTTGDSSYSLTSKVWEKIEKEAIRDRMRTPLMAIDLEDKNRIIVFNPKDFITPLPYDYIQVVESENKSFLIHLGNINKLFTICGKKKSVLYSMRVEEFIVVFKEEL